MPRQEPLSQWIDRVASHMPTLSPCQARVLALWSFGLILCRRCSLSAAALVLAQWLGQPENTLRQRLREFYLEADRKRGGARRQVDPTVCFAPLLRWAAGDSRRVALALDVTNLGERFHVLAIALVCRGGAVPVAWAVLAGNEPGSWNAHWRRLLRTVAAALSPGRTVVALSDRGLESAELFEAIAAAGFHPLMRLKSGGRFRPAGWTRFHRLPAFAAESGMRYRGGGELYATRPLRCVLLACRSAGCADPWLLATDLASAEAGWYAFRAWVEQGFKDIKRGGWDWQNTRMTDPARVERLWVVLSLATLGGLEAGAASEPVAPPRSRPHSLLERGLAALLAGLVRGRLIIGRLPDDPWPGSTLCHKPPAEHEFQPANNTYP